MGAVRDSWLFTYCSLCDSGLRNMLPPGHSRWDRPPLATWVEWDFALMV